jgi:hypothetical protein
MMYRIVLNAMWSKDYLLQLATLLSENIPCELDHAYQVIRELGEGKRLELSPVAGKAEQLACELQQYGCYTEVEQVGPLTDEMMIADMENWFDDDQSHFSVLYDRDGHVVRMVEERGYAFLRMESQKVQDWAGAELLRLGAKRLESEDAGDLNQRLKAAIAANEVRRAKIRTERALEKQWRLAHGESAQEPEGDEE